MIKLSKNKVTKTQVRNDCFKMAATLNSVRLRQGDLLNAKFRRRFFRRFQSWYRANQTRFKFPLFLARKRDDLIELGIGNLPADKITYYLRYAGSDFQAGALSLVWDGEEIDELKSLESYPQRNAAGYSCSQCQAPVIFWTLEELWVDHIFQPLLKLVNETIAPSKGIAFFRLNSGSSYGEILTKSNYDRIMKGEGLLAVLASREDARNFV